MYKEIQTYFGFPEGEYKGLFAAILGISNFPLVDAEALDLYFFTHYGERLGSKFLDLFAHDDDGVLTDESIQGLAYIIHNKYINNWEHEYKTLTVEYNPIENTDYTETVKDVSSGSGRSGASAKKTTVTSENDIWGLNGGQVHDSKTTTETTPGDASSNYSNSGQNDRTIRKHGNIGVTTNAEMIKSDIEVWRLNNFYDILCSDICKEIALSIF